MSNPMLDKKMMEELLEDLRKQIGTEQWAFIVHSARFDPATYALAGELRPNAKIIALRYILINAFRSVLDMVLVAKKLYQKYMKRRKIYVEIKQKKLTQNPDGTVDVKIITRKIKKYPDATAKAKHFYKCYKQLLRRASHISHVIDSLSTPIMGFYQKPPQVILTNEGIAKKESYFFTSDTFAKIKHEVEAIVGAQNPIMSSASTLSETEKPVVEALRRRLDKQKEEYKRALVNPEDALFEEDEELKEMELGEEGQEGQEILPEKQKQENKEEEGEEEEPEVEFR